ncbi:ribosome-releasing factor 2, mitochondrial isoform X7 [Stomoxys calcitrans]|uniref:ribosome-releasing factor 2, mitochondrial isoform X7 n=1 Tax=Stomoxys calcitrans TaxID=35570 RepID=UPI0027E23922|nr:ribosome-releasing factor 2, mitochondrial isoform X7 [Stomoxys calcitrans]
MTIVRAILPKLHRKFAINSYKRCFSSKDIRNIGILAHIDAGKTTTTERMLFYSGKTRALGEVHRGNTVTDYLTQERERGITICSSAVTFTWNNRKINLLDTPGHIDFTMEVEQSLYAVDGVVVVLDGTAGVEAQTVTVWSQADKHRLPKISFINKMDRPDADFDKCVHDLETKLDAKPICIQYPLKDSKGNLSIYDIIRLEHISWDSQSLGRTYQSKAVTDSNILLELQDKRNNLIDKLCSIDDSLAELVITNDGFDKVTNELIYAALRKATCQHKYVPVALGSAYKNVGVQTLMDAVINYLPHPQERNEVYDCFENDFVGKVFKIVHDKQRGPLTLVRVLRGDLKKSMRITSTRGQAEVIGKIYEPLADEYKEIQAVQAGDVAICSGLKHTVTGDLLVTNTTSLKNAQKRLQKSLNRKKDSSLPENDDDDVEMDLINEIFSLEPQIPDAVYFCSIEPPSVSYQNAMELALKQLQREDPSLRVTFDPITGQTVLGGMGELHMDIIKSRILTEYKIEVDLGPLQIAYKETIENNAKTTFAVEKEIAGSKQSVAITLELIRDGKDIFSLDKSAENFNNLQAIRPRTLQVIRKGCLSALERGPKVGGQVVETQIKLHNVNIGRGTADSFLMAAAGQCVQKILTDNGTRLLEPIMALQIVIPSERVSSILADLGRRRATVNDVLPKGERNKLVLVNAPLAELSNYSSILRTISSGTASMTMQPCGFTVMNTNDEEFAIRRAHGFE